MRALALLTWATRAARRSLSPKRISSRGHRVVLVDDRDDPELEQAVQGPLGVAVVAAAHQVVRGQQHLADAEAVRAERLGVAGDEQSLPDAGCRLLGRQVLWALGEPQGGHAGRDRAGGDEQHLLAAAGTVSEGADQRRDADVVDRAVFRRQ